MFILLCRYKHRTLFFHFEFLCFFSIHISKYSGKSCMYILINLSRRFVQEISWEGLGCNKKYFRSWKQEEWLTLFHQRASISMQYFSWWHDTRDKGLSNFPGYGQMYSTVFNNTSVCRKCTMYYVLVQLSMQCLLSWVKLFPFLFVPKGSMLT